MPTLEYWIDSSVLTSIWKAPLTESEIWHAFENLSMIIENCRDLVSVMIVIQDNEALSLDAPALMQRIACFDLPQVDRLVVITEPHQVYPLMKVSRRMTGKMVVFFNSTRRALAYLQQRAATA